VSIKRKSKCDWGGETVHSKFLAWSQKDRLFREADWGEEKKAKRLWGNDFTGDGGVDRVVEKPVEAVRLFDDSGL